MAVRIAYYCSGHGYGHATRVSAFASSLLSVDLELKLEIHIVSSAPETVFSECIACGAHYRYADVDPIIVQPLAYKVDRKKSLDDLQTFLSEKDNKLATEVAWLLSEKIDCVLSDAAFLACESATNACIPSILITNFTFDSVYSYLGTGLTDGAPGLPSDSLQLPDIAIMNNDLIDDAPVPADMLVPLVSQLLVGYCHADVLLLLPGFIPIPSFFPSIPLPAPDWVDPSTNKFRPHIESALLALTSAGSDLHPSVPFPVRTPDSETPHANDLGHSKRKPLRTVKHAPLIVRPVSPEIHTLEGRSNLLSSIGIPEILHNPSRTQILVVSFGGQKIRRPHGGRSPLRSSSPTPIGEHVEYGSTVSNHQSGYHASLSGPVLGEKVRFHGHGNIQESSNTHLRRSSSTKIFIPGAPTPTQNPASPLTSSSSPLHPELQIIESERDRAPSLEANPLPRPPTSVNLAPEQEQEEPSLLPSSSWIAIICGVPSNWSVSKEEEELPPGFYVAPSNVYMPDLTAVADVLLGKLGYGTVSEAVAQSTPIVYVPRPLFVEEHGLRLFLEAEGTGVQMSREDYESGAWASKVEEAYLKGKKRQKRGAEDGVRNVKEVKDLARWVLLRVKEWKISSGRPYPPL